jgi:hypothetical protein
MIRIFSYSVFFQDDLTLAAAQQLFQTDRWGNTPLHAACHHKPPVSTINALLTAARLLPAQVLLLLQHEEEERRRRTQKRSASHSTTTTTRRIDSTTTTTTTTNRMVPAQARRNARGATPLLIACLCGASTDVLQELLYHHPHPPLSSSSSSSSSQTSTAGWSAGHHPKQATNTTTATTTIDSENTSSGTHAVFVADEFARTPLLAILLRYENNQSIQRILPPAPHRSAFYYHQEYNDMSSFAKAVELLLTAGWKARRNNRTINTNGRSENDNTDDDTCPLPSVLHRAAFMAAYCPTRLTDLILKFMDNDRDQTKEEEEQRGDYCAIPPLHMALATAATTPTTTTTTTSQLQQQGHRYPALWAYQQQYMMEQLIQRNPDAVRQPIASTNRTVLSQAIVMGLQWHRWQVPEQQKDDVEQEEEEEEPYELSFHLYDQDDTDTVETLSSSSSSSFSESEKETNPSQTTQRLRLYPGPLQSLFRCAPDALTMTDTVTGLYPFQLAAAAAAASVTNDNNYRNNKQQEDDDRLAVNTIYNLLRLAPQLV